MKKKIERLPNHIGFIMDGNGRWAKRRLMPRSLGHRQGVKNVIEIVTHCFNLGIKAVSLYAFSAENWARPKEEVDALFELLRTFFEENLKKLIKDNVKLLIMGDLSKLPDDLRKMFQKSIKLTENNSAYILNIGINYGGRQEILKAVNACLSSGKKSVDKLDFENNLYTANLPELDLVVRTGGENRISNFMLYQCAYSELYFTKTLWPDFHKKQLDNALLNYSNRNRKFGGVQND